MSETAIEPRETTDEANDREVLHLVMDRRVPWHIDELGTVLLDSVKAADSIARLRANGLIHRLEDFVWPTVAADYADKIESE